MTRLYTRDNELGRDFLSGAMMSYWTQFAYQGDPGNGRAGDLPKWTAWKNGADTDKYMILDTQSDGGLRVAKDRMTPQRLLTEITSDSRLADDEAKCSVAQYIQERYALWTNDTVASEACSKREPGTRKSDADD
jgi:para-nitrobenzyl esterase